MKLMASPVATVIIFGILTGSISVSQSSFINYHHCGTNGNYTSDSIYNKNLDSALANLSSAANTSDSGSYNASMGEDSDKVNALVLCRGDVQPHICRSCVKDSSKRLREQCPDQKEAVNWEDECMLRYSNNWTLKNLVMEPTKAAINTTDATDGYYSELSFLLNDLRKEAVQQWFATKNRSRPDFLTIYGLLQCTPDLSQEQCDHCFDSVIGAINSSCSKDIGCQIMNPSCRLRFEANRFYNKTVYNYVPPAPPSSSAPPPGKDDSTMGTVIIIVVVIVGFVILVLILICIFKRKSRQRSATETWQNDVKEDINSAELLQYHFAAVEFATNYFSGNRKLGQGGFGAVYKGTLKSGQEVAVKRLSKGSNQGEQEFKNEVLLVAKLQHRNLVRLHGFCYEGTERILIYEFVPNGSLDHFLFDLTKRSLLDWKRRYKIIGGVARGLLYLHEDSRLRIIHRDLKASNVLLDADINPKIADFGVARLFDMDETQGNTSRPAGTYGYMAPEYAMYGQFSVKSDVFSFGVLVLEIVSGQKNNSIRSGEIDEDLASAAWKNLKEGNASNVIDPTLRNSSESIREMIRCIHIGLLCVQENVAERPTMASVVFMLNSSSLTLALPSEPAFFMHNSTDPEVSSSEDTLNSTVSTYKSIKAKEKYFDHSFENSCSTDLYPL